MFHGNPLGVGEKISSHKNLNSYLLNFKFNSHITKKKNSTEKISFLNFLH